MTKVQAFIAGKLALAMVCMLLGLGLFATITPQNAAAHGERDVDGGKYQIRFGFANEPAAAGSQNGIELVVCEGKCKTTDGKVQNPVKDVEKTLKAQVIFGGQTLDVALQPDTAEPGRYTAAFVPSRAGDYSFRFYGTIGSSKIDENVSSGKDSFDPVEEPKVFPAGSGYTGQTSLERQLQEAKKAAESATTFGNIALAVSIVSFLIALGALISAGSRGRSRKAAITLPREKTTSTTVGG